MNKVKLGSENKTMGGKVFSCPFCKQKLFCITSGQQGYIWTKCEHLIYLEYDKKILHCESNIGEFLKKRALPIKFLKDYLELQNRDVNNRNTKNIVAEGLSLQDYMVEVVLHGLIGYCCEKKNVFLLDFKDFVLNDLSVREVKINTRTFIRFTFT